MSEGPPSILAVVRAVLMRSVLRPPQGSRETGSQPQDPTNKADGKYLP